jgi:hypothetical protein
VVLPTGKTGFSLIGIRNFQVYNSLKSAGHSSKDLDCPESEIASDNRSKLRKILRCLKTQGGKELFGISGDEVYVYLLRTILSELLAYNQKGVLEWQSQD